MEPNNKICQSCGLPMPNDSTNQEYCHFCWQDGKFTEPNITMEEKIDKVAAIAVKNMNMSRDKALDMAYNVIPKLKRWRK